ncbi:thioredoxin family protein [Planctomicrobium piriforme]|nr:thioredoxin family protein [Planctomicrobium piriforme]
MRRTLLLLLLNLTLLCPLALAAETSTADKPAEVFELPPAKSAIKWRINLAEAQAEAKAANKPLLILFTAPSWCGPCRMFESGTMPEAPVGEAVNEHLICVYMDDSQRDSFPQEYQDQVRAALKQLDVHAFPSFVFADADLQPLAGFAGGGDVDSFVKRVEESRTAFASASSALAGQKPQDITDPAQLDKFLSALPSELVEGFWYPTVERLVASNKDNPTEVHQKWSKWVDDLNARKESDYLANMRGMVPFLLARGKSPAEVQVTLDKELAESAGKPTRLQVLAVQQGRVFIADEKPEEALKTLESVLQSSAAHKEDQETAKSLKAAALIQLNRTDAALVLATETVEIPADTSDVTKADLIDLKMVELSFTAKRLEGVLDLLRRVDEHADPATIRRLAGAVSEYHSIIGGQDEFLGRLRLNIVRTAPNLNELQKLAIALTSIVNFEAAGNSESAAAAREFVASLPAPTPEMLANPQLPQLIEAGKDRVSALKFLSKNSRGAVKAQYLLQAALCCRECDRQDQVQELIVEADKVLAELPPSTNPTALHAAQELRKKCES